MFEKIVSYEDKFPFLELRKKIWNIKAIFVYICQKIVSNKLFENLCLAIIIWNAITQTATPTASGNNDISSTEWFFIIFYTIEMFLKIFAMGFILNKDAYMRDLWNMMDILIVVTSWVPVFLTNSNINLSAFRTLRILRPLRTIKNIKALRSILVALISALPLLKDVMII